MNTNIHKCTEIHNIADSSLKHHPRSQVFHIQHIASEHRTRHLVARVSSRLFQLLYNILQSQFTNPQLFCRFLRLTYFLRDTFQSSSDNILCGISKRSQAPSMRSAAQKYYVQQNVFDLRVLSTLGLSDQDIAAIAATPGVEAVMPVKTLDLEANWQGQEERMVVQLQALQQDPAADTDANMNRLVLRSGRMPQAADECVVHVMGYQAEIAEGTVLTLPEDTEGTKHKEYTVVGLVQDPQHISTDKESSTVGNGQLNYIAYVLDGELTADYYTACYIKAENAGRYDNYSQEYQEAVDQVADRLEQISTAQCVQRREQLIDTANQKLAEARQTYDDQKAEAEQKFAEAEQQLDDAQKQLDDAKAQLDAGETELDRKSVV